MIDHGKRIEVILTSMINQHEKTLGSKTSAEMVEPAIVSALSQAGYTCDPQDTRRVYPGRVPTWRTADGIVESKARRRIDVVAYCGNEIAAFIESESDLGDLTFPVWSCKGYAVYSIARNATGRHFESYWPLERMAIAAIGRARLNEEEEDLLQYVESIASNDASAHNPLQIPLFLTLARPLTYARTRDKIALLEPRLTSLGAKIIVAP
jgi:hypothetical protein